MKGSIGILTAPVSTSPITAPGIVHLHNYSHSLPGNIKLFSLFNNFISTCSKPHKLKFENKPSFLIPLHVSKTPPGKQPFLFLQERFLEQNILMFHGAHKRELQCWCHHPDKLWAETQADMTSRRTLLLAGLFLGLFGKPLMGCSFFFQPPKKKL